jgi:hypothetical protein
MQAFASPAENRASYPTEGQGGYGEKATYPLAGKLLGLRLTVMGLSTGDAIACGLRRLPIDISPDSRASGMKSSVVKDLGSA